MDQSHTVYENIHSHLKPIENRHKRFGKFFLKNQQDDTRLQISDQSVDCLDVTIYKGTHFETAGYLDYNMFFKPTDTHQPLLCKSFHPHHTFKGIVKSQIIRFQRNSSNKENFNEACSVLFSALKPRGYSTR